MEISAIKFNGKPAPKSVENLAMDVGFSYTMPFPLPKPVRFFGKEFDFFEVGMRGQLRLGKWENELVDNPLSMSDFKFGNILVPVGERLTTRACSAYIYMWMEHDVIYLSFKLKDEHTKKMIYTWQVQFPLYQPNVVEFHYHHVQTGFNTLVGVRGPGPKDILEYFDFDPDHAYSRTALRFDTTPSAIEEPKPEEENPAIPEKPADIPGYHFVLTSTPFGMKWVKRKDYPGTGTPADKWATVWQGKGYRVQEALK